MYTWHDANYNKRIKLTIDGSKIKEDLYNFPIMIHLSNSSGITKVDTTCVFDELENNSKKIALYTAISGSDIQCCVEVDYWSTSSGFEDAVLWAKIPTISSGTDLDLYLYYDKNVSDNSYVGETGEYSAQQVWDSNFKAVYHLSQSPTGGNGCIKDSTGNNNDGTPQGSMASSDLVDGKVGKALDFDGSDDYIEVADADSLDISSYITLETVLKSDDPQSGVIIQPCGKCDYQLNFDHSNTSYRGSFAIRDGSTWYSCSGPLTITDSVWHHFVGCYDGTYMKTFWMGWKSSALILDLIQSVLIVSVL